MDPAPRRKRDPSPPEPAPGVLRNGFFMFRSGLPGDLNPLRQFRCQASEKPLLPLPSRRACRLASQGPS